jgi:hypothetical protein
MGLLAPLRRRIADRLIRISDTRAPDFVIGQPGQPGQPPYLQRWWLIPKNRFFNMYLHKFLRSDDDRAMHDHPWCNLSWLLRGAYLEVIPGQIKVRRAGDFAMRRPTARHRIELIERIGWRDNKPYMTGQMYPAWTLFITGPIVRSWGFWCPQGFVRWQDFTADEVAGGKGVIGKGCAQ